MELLNIDANAKTIKGQGIGYMTAVLYLAPYNIARSEINLCAFAKIAGCVKGCLNLAGRGGMSAGNVTFTADNGMELPDNSIMRARIARTVFFLDDNVGFMAQLVKEIRAFIKKAKKKGLIPVVRLNGTSDILWELIPCGNYASIFAAFPDIQFYDYTKIPNRRHAVNVSNYYLTYSYSGNTGEKYFRMAQETYGSSVNAAVVFQGAMPAEFMGRKVINGDESDLRFLDESSVIVGLKAKGRMRKDTSGFCVTA